MTTNDLIDHTFDLVQNLPTYAERLKGWALGNAWWVGLLCILASAGACISRRLLSRGQLADRAALELLPTTGFDPKPEEVVRFAHQVARSQKSVSRWLFTPSRGTAVRVRFTSAGGPLVMRVEGPAKALTVLRHQGYAECEVRAAGQDLPDRERVQIRFGDDAPLTASHPTAA
ncbi:hypothetical protein OG800_49375 (plasmid) [Streptomyces sp. NBC_00445]|uniref:hypothetical protein n=1 Tax=Streptomyces sp. NBC_00445 TaxID=2975745 RepID=UPI002E1E44A9